MNAEFKVQKNSLALLSSFDQSGGESMYVSFVDVLSNTMIYGRNNVAANIC